jgi:REP element-mobilizing transposase RayT
VRDLIRDICGQHEVKIMKGQVAKDHVHSFVSIPPQVTISRLLQWLKGKTAHHLMAEFYAHQEAVLGAAPVGAGIFLLQFGECDPRGHSKVDRRTKHRAG